MAGLVDRRDYKVLEVEVSGQWSKVPFGFGTSSSCQSWDFAGPGYNLQEQFVFEGLFSGSLPSL